MEDLRTLGARKHREAVSRDGKMAASAGQRQTDEVQSSDDTEDESMEADTELGSISSPSKIFMHGERPDSGFFLNQRLSHLHIHPEVRHVQQKLKDHLKKRFTYVPEGTSRRHSRLESVYTNLYITQQTEEHTCKSHEILDHFKPSDHGSWIDCKDIFSPAIISSAFERKSPKRRVMTKGIAGIGKTLAVQNFSLNWALERYNWHIDFIFFLPFRELNMLREVECSLLQLLVKFYPELEPLQDTGTLENMQVLFIFDGLDESRFSLDFDGNMRVSDTNQRSTVDVLLTNLIEGNLLPNALIWITSRPAAAGQIPSKFIDRITELQGFTDRQKEAYFRKRFSSGHFEEVLSCLRGMISFHFMGHIPIFCWITAEVLRKEWGDQRSRMITTMTELYISYLLIQTERTTQKSYNISSERRAHKKNSDSQNAALIFNLSKLAFEQLQQGNIIFYEEDLRECGIDPDESLLFCGFCTQILKQEFGLYQKKMFSFVHLSFQEFLAALYMLHCCVTKNVDTLMSFLDVEPLDLSLCDLQKRVVDKALKTENGHLDLFLCFFLGLSLESNQTMLQRLLPWIKSSTELVEEMKKYLKTFHAGNIQSERCLNLLLCKYELKEERFQDDIRMLLCSGIRLSHIDCIVLSTILQLSGELVEELDLTKCFTPFTGTEKLLLLLKNCKRALLKSEHLRNGPLLFSILQSADSCLQELCLVCSSNGNSPLSHDLFVVLGSRDCKLETLRLTGFSLDSRHCQMLASILQTKQHPLRVLDVANCIYSYPQDYSGYYSKELGKIQEYDDVVDELSPLTLIPSGLIGPLCALREFRMPGCFLKSKCCQVFASVLSSNSVLRALDLSCNDLQDLGVQLLSVGLGSLKCRLEILRLSCCGITEEGCAFLASALQSNPSHLRELDLSYNHPGESGVETLSKQLVDPTCSLEKLNVDHDEEHWVNPLLLHKYACDLTFDPDTLNQHLILSDCNREVKHTEERQPYPDHPERFDLQHQVLCREGLTGRHYWEVDWKGFVSIGVAYKSLERKGSWNSQIDRSCKAWCFNITVWNGYSFWHKLRETFLPIPVIDVQAFLARQMRIGLFLDWPAGTLSFYWLNGEAKSLLHTFHTTFTEPLYPAFTVNGSSLALSRVEKLNVGNVMSRFKPEVIMERIGISYRFKFPSSGVFQCSLTGLVFHVTRKCEVTYRTLIWDDRLLHPASKVPGGPLFSIKCPDNTICQLHLPHCEPEPSLVSESLSVVHVTNDGMSIIQPLRVTDTHVVVDISHLSAFGIVWDLIQRFTSFGLKPINGQVLLFLRPGYSIGTLILSVIMLPSNVPLLEVKAQHANSEYIQAPSYCHLYKDQHYSLHSDPAGYKIQPPRALFFENYGPNYHATFEIVLKRSSEEVNLTVRDQGTTPVWEYSFHLPEEKQPRVGTKSFAEEELERIRLQFIYRVSDPVLNKLLDELLELKVINEHEAEAPRNKPREEKARGMIDAVKRKGAEASSELITILLKNDPYLCKELHLM
ncbi:NACHT, LRR and PYD domains-containing protein 12-like isoform 2-T3 [Aulostomus maculatus]